MRVDINPWRPMGCGGRLRYRLYIEKHPGDEYGVTGDVGYIEAVWQFAIHLWRLRRAKLSKGLRSSAEKESR